MPKAEKNPQEELKEFDAVVSSPEFVLNAKRHLAKAVCATRQDLASCAYEAPEKFPQGMINFLAAYGLHALLNHAVNLNPPSDQ